MDRQVKESEGAVGVEDSWRIQVRSLTRIWEAFKWQISNDSSSSRWTDLFIIIRTIQNREVWILQVNDVRFEGGGNKPK